MPKTLLLSVIFFFYLPILKAQNNACIDSSSRFLLQTPGNSQIFIQQILTLRDTSIIVAGRINNNSTTDSSMFIARFDKNNNILFSKRITGFAGFPQKITQCKNGDLLVLVRNLSNNANGQLLILFRFDVNGNMLWQKSLDDFQDTQITSSFYARTLLETSTGEILVGNSFEKETDVITGDYSGYFIFYKLNSTGNLIWKKVLVKNEILALRISNINEQNGIISAITSHSPTSGVECNSTNRKTIGLISLNATTGNYISSKAICLSNFSAGCNWSIDYEAPSVEFQSSGNILLTGTLYACSNNYAKYILQTDKNFNILNNHEITYKTPLGTNSGATVLSNQFNEVSLFTRGYTNNTLYYATINGGGTAFRQRKISLPLNSQHNYGSIRTVFRKKDNFWIVNNVILNSQNLTQIMEFKGDNNQTADCTGEDTAFITTKPHISYNIPFIFDTLKNESATTTTTNFTIEDLQLQRTEICTSYSICDSLKIKGKQEFCLSEPEQTFTIYKNEQCFKKPVWQIDTSVISSLQQINDSTIKIKFRKSWSGYLYAKTQSCTKLNDSLFINVYDTVKRIQLGNDTTLCTSVTLDAGPNFKSYRWQNITGTRYFTVKDSGLYYVTATDNCGNTFSDSIYFYPKKQRVFLGNDTCVTSFPFPLTAGSGFKDYKWQNGSLSQSFAVTDYGMYFVNVTNACSEKYSDSIRIYKSTKLFTLGNDTTLCPGQPLMINAPDGFNSYTWQNGSLLKSIEVKEPGNYSVTITDYCGLTKADTIKVVKSNYRFNLTSDTSICKYDFLNITVAPGALNYYWQPFYNISSLFSDSINVNPEKQTTYIVRAEISNGCFIYDSVKVSVNECPETIFIPSAFTPNRDGLNDLFSPVVKGIFTSYYFEIYNRWGEKVFESKKRNEGWDGLFKGQPQSSGTYTWVFKFKRLTDKNIQLKKGTFILIR